MPKTKRRGKDQRSKARVKKMKVGTITVENHGLNESEVELHSDPKVHEVFQRLQLTSCGRSKAAWTSSKLPRNAGNTCLPVTDSKVTMRELPLIEVLSPVITGRISKFWKLVDNPLLRKRTVMLEFPSDVDHGCRMALDDRLRSITRSDDSWTDSMPMIKGAKIQHLVTIGPSSDYSFSGVSAVSSELNNVTYCNQDYYFDYFSWAYLPTFVKSITLVNCSVNFYDYGFYIDTENQYWRSIVETPPKRPPLTLAELYYRRPQPHDAEWNWKMTIPHLVMDRSTIPVFEGSFEDDHLALRVVLARALDAHGLIWPYPKEQLQWLLTSLDKLEVEVLEVVKNTDRVWQESCRESAREICGEHWEKHLDKLEVTSMATSDGRRLSSLDLAFFGRLLVSLDKVRKLPNFQSPPFKFPEESQINIHLKQEAPV